MGPFNVACVEKNTMISRCFPVSEQDFSRSRINTYDNDGIPVHDDTFDFFDEY